MRSHFVFACILLCARCGAGDTQLPAAAAKHLQDAVTALSSNEIHNALAHADSALLFAPQSSHAHFVRGQALYVLTDFAAARQAWERASALEPANFAWWQSLGDVAFQQEDYLASLNYYQRALRINPDAISWHGAAGAYWELSQTEQARSACEKALVLDSTYAPAYLSLSVIAEHEGNLRDALAHAHSALEIAVDDPQSLLTAGRLYRLLEEPTEAIPLLQKALDAAPHSSEVRYNLAQALQQAGLEDEAVQVSKGAKAP